MSACFGNQNNMIKNFHEIKRTTEICSINGDMTEQQPRQKRKLNDLMLKRAERKRNHKLNKIEKRKAYLAKIATQGLLKVDSQNAKQEIQFQICQKDFTEDVKEEVLTTLDGHKIIIKRISHKNQQEQSNISITTMTPFESSPIMKQQIPMFHIQAKMNLPHLSHLDWFWNIINIKQSINNVERENCQERIRTLMEVFPNCKEISESVCAFRTIEHLCPDLLSLQPSKSQTILVIGDGSLPRTAMLFSEMILYKSKPNSTNNNEFGQNSTAKNQTTIISVDPQLNNTYLKEKSILSKFFIDCESTTIEKWIQSEVGQWVCSKEKNCIYIVCVHSHARFDDFMDLLLPQLSCDIVIFTIKCCGIQQSFSDKQLQIYSLVEIQHAFDWGVFSPHREYYVWQRKNTKQNKQQEATPAVECLLDVFYFLIHECNISECCVDLVMTYYLPGVMLYYLNGMFITFKNLMNIVLNGNEDGKHFYNYNATEVMYHPKKQLIFVNGNNCLTICGETYSLAISLDFLAMVYPRKIYGLCRIHHNNGDGLISHYTIYKFMNVETNSSVQSYKISTLKTQTGEIYLKHYGTISHPYDSFLVLPNINNTGIFTFALISDTDGTINVVIKQYEKSHSPSSDCAQTIAVKLFRYLEAELWFEKLRHIRFGFCVSEDWIVISSFFVMFVFTCSTKTWKTHFYKDDSNVYDRYNPLLFDNFIVFFTRVRKHDQSLIEASVYDLFDKNRIFAKEKTQQQRVYSRFQGIYELRDALPIQ